MSKTVQLKFDDKQEHQLQAIESTMQLFAGLPLRETKFQLGDEIVPNLAPHAALQEGWLLANLNEVRQRNGLEPLLALDMDDGFELEGISNNSWRYPNFSLEMETGTGKTYVYLRTIHELHEQYGFKKFVIVVPSVAIYEGVVKNIQITKAHFRALYSNAQIHLTEYDGQQVSKLRSFASSTDLQVLVITLDSFNKKSNVIYKPSERLPGERRPYQYIQETRPIMILDEPQNMESGLAKAALRTLHALLALRYSATHRTCPNLFFRLTPVDAFKKNLVKKIQVYGVKEEQSLNQNLLLLESVEPFGPTAKVRTIINDRGVRKEAVVELRKGDDLYQKTRVDAYKDTGLVVDEIDRRLGVVIFANQQRLSLHDETASTVKIDVFKTQVRETIDRHMQAYEQLKPKGVKVLSLFFIDRVANYTEENGIVRRLFDEEFDKLKKKYESFWGLKPEDVRSAYFAAKKNKKGEMELLDTESKNEEERKAEKVAYKLIMRDKERLLSFDEKVCFIFAHSALKEGWDNPNVFQICTLNPTRSEMKKRQEIGRGLRICVNQDGERVMDEGVNVLTVIANESYEDYVSSLQNEYVEDGYATPARPTNARKDKARRNDKVFKGRDFIGFWNNLSQRTRYVIQVDTETLTEQCIASLSATSFPEPQIVVTKGKFVITQYLIELQSVTSDHAKFRVTIADTSGNERVNTHTFSVRDDLQKIFKDERLKGYRILRINEGEPDASVEFDNGQILSKFNPIKFDSEAGQTIDSRLTLAAESTYPVFNFIDHIAKETGLTRPTINRIFRGLAAVKKELVLKNPEGFANTFLTKVKDVLANHIAERIQYIVEGYVEEYDLDEFFPILKAYPQKEVIDGDQNSLYDQIQIDSDVEERFVKHQLQKEDEIVLYFKFPGKFKINIPKIIGNYNPDWGVIRWTPDRTMKLQLVRETKGARDRNLLQWPNEKRKLICAEKHFDALGIDYCQITGDEPFWWKRPGKK